MRHFGCNRDEHFPIGRRELQKVGGMTLVGTGLEDVNGDFVSRVMESSDGMF
jgi:hypothetical protein